MQIRTSIDDKLVKIILSKNCFKN